MQPEAQPTGRASGQRAPPWDHRSLTENGPCTTGVTVLSTEVGDVVTERWQAARPDVWCALMIDGRVYERAAPRESRSTDKGA